jgi:mono/diheme cytochrome c family protein
VCHGSGAKGDGPAAAALQPPPADLTRIAARRGGEFPAPDIAAFIDGRRDLAAHGSRAMPIWGRRFAEDVGSDETGEEMIRGTLAVLVEYLKSIQAK